MMRKMGKVGVGTYQKCTPLLTCCNTCWSLEQQENFFGQIEKWALKAIVKDHVVKTQQRPDKFAEQCAIRECEAWQLNFIINDVSIQLGINRKNEPTNTSKFQPQWKFTASFGGMNSQSMMPVCMHFQDDKKNRMGFSVSDRFKFCIQSLAERVGFEEKIQITGHTTLKVYEKDCM